MGVVTQLTKEVGKAVGVVPDKKAAPAAPAAAADKSRVDPAAAMGAAALRARRGGMRSLLSPDRTDAATGLARKLGG